MAVYSMTGYATAQQGGPAASPGTEPARDLQPALGVEIRSVNSRFLDLTFKLPDDLRGSEPALRELLGARLKRGKVEVRAWIEGRSDASPRSPILGASTPANLELWKYQPASCHTGDQWHLLYRASLPPCVILRLAPAANAQAPRQPAPCRV